MAIPSQRTFGVELEMLTPTRGPHIGMDSHRFTQLMAEAGFNIARESYNHTTRGYWKVTTDISVGSDGWELVSPILQGEAGLAELRKVCEKLVELGVKVSKKCGMHVHIGHNGMTPREKAEVFLRYAKLEKKIDWMLAPSRRGPLGGNQMVCGMERWIDSPRLMNVGSTEADWRDVVRTHIGTRYLKVNVCTFPIHNVSGVRNYPTIEFRQHQGTIEPDKVCNWVQFVMAFVETSIVKIRGSVPVEVPMVDVLGSIKKSYRGRTTKSYLVAGYLLNRPDDGLTREQLSVAAGAALIAEEPDEEKKAELRKDIGNDLTQISVILEHFKKKGFGLVKTKVRERDGSKVRYKLVPRSSTTSVPYNNGQPDDWTVGVPENIVQYYRGRIAHFKREAGIPVEETQEAA